MKTLGLLRHAKSDWNDATLRDFDRGLNERGRRGARLMGEHITGRGISWEQIVASPAERVRRTLEATELNYPIRWEERAYLANSQDLIGLLRSVEGDPASLLLVGHNPGLQDLIFEFVAQNEENDHFAAAAEKFPTATFAVLDLAIDRWEQCAPGCGRLAYFARPRDLDSSLGPETTNAGLLR